MDQKLESFLVELEQFGFENDKGVTDKAKRMRNVTTLTGQFLSFMVSATKAKHVLEIGTSNGYSTLWLADSVSANNGFVTTIEYSESKAELAKFNFEKAEMNEWINLKVMDAGVYIKNAESQSVDMIFLDSERKEYVEWWKELSRILKPNGLVMVDNVTSHASELEEFVAFVSKDEDFKSVTLPIESGLLLLTKRGVEHE
jgi:predicted O-methyltransferase YrrM